MFSVSFPGPPIQAEEEKEEGDPSREFGVLVCFIFVCPVGTMTLT